VSPPAREDTAARPSVEVVPGQGTLRGIALFCHGGAATGVRPPREQALSLVRMRAFERAVREAAGPRGVTTQLLRYRVVGWNGDTADAYADLRWALDRVREEHGPDVPVVLVGHSMGGRAVLRAGGDPSVRAVCALAPWTPPGEPVDHLRGRLVTVLHGSGDRWVPPALSAGFAVRARAAGARVARFTTPGGHGMLRGAERWHAFALAVVLAGTGLAPLRQDIADALAAPGDDGLAAALRRG
jgi:dienelactone hydrolase